MTAPATYDHLRPSDDEYDDGVYRVVGTSEKTVTLLKVGDADGRRVNTGQVITVRRGNLDRFATAENPRGHRSFGSLLSERGDKLYWTVRSIISQLLAHPIPATIAVSILLAGEIGYRMGYIPSTLSAVLSVTGALGVAYIGSGKLSDTSEQDWEAS